VAVAIAVIGWAAVGPFREGWARRAGTPVSLLGASQPQAAGVASTSGGAAAAPDPSPSTPASAPAAASLTAPFQADYSGQITQHNDASGITTVSIDGALSGGATGRLAVVLSGPALAGGGVQLQNSTVTLGSPQQPQSFTGQVEALSGSELTASVRDQAGRRMTVAIDLHIDASTSNVTGRVTAQPGAAGGSGRNDSE
jgi:hypothetical protein